MINGRLAGEESNSDQWEPRSSWVVLRLSRRKARHAHEEIIRPMIPYPLMYLAITLRYEFPVNGCHSMQ